MAKPVAASTKKSPTPPVAEKDHRRLTHHERLLRKTSNMGDMTVSAEDASYEVTMTGRTPVELIGHLLDMTPNHVVFRYKVPRSSKTVVSRFQNSDVIRVIGNVGEPASLLLLKNAPFVNFTGQVTALKNGFIKVTSENGDSMLVNPSLRLENFSLYMNSEQRKAADESEEGEEIAEKPVKVAAKTSAKAPATSAKVTNINSAKKAKKAATVSAFDDDESEAAFG